MQAYSSAHTVLLSILMMHMNWAFSVHNDKHIDRVLYYYLFNTGQRDLYMCLFLYLVHLLYHEVGLKYECCWSFLVTLTVCGVTFYLGKQQAQVSSLCQRRYFPKQRLTLKDPIRQPGSLTFFLFCFFGFFFGQQWLFFFCMLPISTAREWHLPVLPFWLNFLRVLWNYAVAHKWSLCISNRWNETNDVLKISITEI